MKILIIEDDASILEIVSLALTMRWPESNIISTNLGLKGIEMAEQESPELIILDLGLPDIDGLDVLKKIRLVSQIPIVILTVRGSESDIVRGLEWGADEYIIKPFRQLELMARIHALLRRQYVSYDNLSVSAGLLKLNLSTRLLLFNNKNIYLTNTESLILYHLMKNAGKVLTTQKIGELVWGLDYPGSSDAIRVYIRRLRKKIEIYPNQPELIQTKAGLGYFLKKSN